METTLIIIAVIVGLAIGMITGWFAGGRPVADLRARLAESETDATKREAEFKSAIKELGDARIEIATLTANAANFDKQIEQMREAREELVNTFKATSGEVLSKAQEEFLKRADEKFGDAEKANKEAVASSTTRRSADKRAVMSIRIAGGD